MDAATARAISKIHLTGILGVIFSQILTAALNKKTSIEVPKLGHTEEELLKQFDYVVENHTKISW